MNNWQSITLYEVAAYLNGRAFRPTDHGREGLPIIRIAELNRGTTDATGRWAYTEPDWAELKSVVTGHGPASQERLEFRRVNFADTQWVRDALLGTATAAA